MTESSLADMSVVPWYLAMISWSPTVSVSTVKVASPSAPTATSESSLPVVSSVKVTVPAVTGSSRPVTAAVNVTDAPTTDGLGVDASTVVDSSLTPYTRFWMDSFASPRVREIAIVAATQLGKTETLLNLIRYIVAEDGGPTLWVAPAETLVRSFSESRLQPSLRDCPPCAAQIPDDADQFKLTEMHLKECTIKGKLDDDCMKSRGWVAVTPPQAEQKKDDPLSLPAGRSPRR